jgi:DNA invertase Pin-like site-specific DNA recombinase
MDTPTKTIRAAIYARVSTTDQNCAIQLQELRQYCQARGWEAVEFVDEGISGAKASRPSLNRLMEAARTRTVDVVMVSRLDRFGRSVAGMSQNLLELEGHGVRFIAIHQGIDTDKANPISKLLLNVLASIAEFERELIRERTRAGLKAARAKGKTLGRPRLVLDRQAVAELRAEGLSWRQIGERLGISFMTARDAYQQYMAASTAPAVD